MLVVESRFNNDKFFSDTPNTTENDVYQQECLKEPINKRKALSSRKGNGHEKKLIKLATKLSVKNLFNTCSVSYMNMMKKRESSR